mmetsp:Transcript_15314/g.14889  ORF Transcript_15314/g.14889 Transcript_15314/m.14889 type:complete len:144 (+) Transcript_15314:772-1203(+)
MTETIRIDPPVPISSSFKFTEPTKIGPYMLRDDHFMFINFYELQHNPKEWIEPEEFIPERFDPESPYFKTPSGQRRNPASYSPFLGGKRVCLGKTFAEKMSRIIFTMMVWNFDFQFQDEKFYTTKPNLNMFTNKQVEVMMNIK